MSGIKHVKIFISHSSEEKDLALAWKTLLMTISMGALNVWLSSDTDVSGGIKLGSQWRENIQERLLDADAVVAVLSPRSAQRPWILWECGMAVGAKQDERALIPIVYSMKFSELGDPLGAYQGYSGDDRDKVIEVCSRLIALTGMSPEQSMWQQPVDQYINTVRLHKPPRAAGPTQVSMWSNRIDDMIRVGRVSELGELIEGMYSSFGARQAIDATLHDRLSRTLLEYKQYGKAFEEVEKAIELSSDDLFLHHRKALILLELGQLDQASVQLEYIEQEFAEAPFLPEVAGAKGRLHRELYRKSNNHEDLEKAIQAYRNGYDRYKQSYYCGVNAIALLQTAGRSEEATTLAREVLDTCEELLQWPEQSFWLDFTIAELYVILEQPEKAIEAYQRGIQRKPAPSPREKASALQGGVRALEQIGRVELQPRLQEILED